VDKLFGGQLVSTIVCEQCHNSSQIYEPFLDLSLPLIEEKQQRPGKGRDNNTLFEDENDGTTTSCFGGLRKKNLNDNESTKMTKAELKKAKALTKRQRKNNNKNKNNNNSLCQESNEEPKDQESSLKEEEEDNNKTENEVVDVVGGEENKLKKELEENEKDDNKKSSDVEIESEGKKNDEEDQKSGEEVAKWRSGEEDHQEVKQEQPKEEDNAVTEEGDANNHKENLPEMDDGSAKINQDPELAAIPLKLELQNVSNIVANTSKEAINRKVRRPKKQQADGDEEDDESDYSEEETKESFEWDYGEQWNEDKRSKKEEDSNTEPIEDHTSNNECTEENTAIDEKIQVPKVSLNPLPPERLVRTSEEREKSSEPSNTGDLDDDDEDLTGSSAGDIEDNLEEIAAKQSISLDMDEASDLLKSMKPFKPDPERLDPHMEALCRKVRKMSVSMSDPNAGKDDQDGMVASKVYDVSADDNNEDTTNSSAYVTAANNDESKVIQKVRIFFIWGNIRGNILGQYFSPL
jgi:hypothetical protein